MTQISYYAMDKEKNLFRFQWSSDNNFYVFKQGKYIKADIKLYNIVNIAMIVSE